MGTLRVSVVRVAALAALLLLAGPPGAAAQTVGVRAYVTPSTTVAAGSSFVVNLEVTGAQRLDQDPQPPDLSAFARYLGSGTSTSIQMAGGRSSVSLTIQYRFQALQEGTFQIPALEVRAGGSPHRTDAIRLTVSAAQTPAAGAPPGGGGAGAGGASAGGSVSPEDLFVTAEASRTRVREGEPLVVEYRIWARVDVGSYGFTDLPEPRGFVTREIDPQQRPRVEQVTRDGVPYATAVIRKVVLVPIGSGERTIDPVGVQAQVRVRRQDDPFSRFFGGSSLFGTTTVPTTVLSNPLTVEVDPLPPGRPEPFSGVVGTLDLRASLDRDSVAVGEAVTLTVRASGEGNIAAVPAPELDLPGDFEVYPPDVSDSTLATDDGLSGTRSFQYVLIPRAPGSRELPGVSMGYYDTGAGAYRRASTDALPLLVTGTGVAGPAAGVRSGVPELREDIRFIHLGPPALRPVHGDLFRMPSFWLLALLPMLGVAGALGLRRHRDRLEGDVAWARGRRAGRVARRRLADARRLSGGEDPRPFYAEVARALRGFVADKLNLAEAGMQMADLRSGLVGAGVSAETADEVAECLEHCDRQRFAPPGTDDHGRARMLERAGDLMTALDREIGR